jgi:hypothetical protein
MAMGVPDGGFPPAKLRSFTNRTMQDNWWEDREQEEYYKKHPLDTSCMSESSRCLPNFNQLRDFSTTTAEHFKGAQCAPPRKGVARMVQVSNYYRETTTDRSHASKPASGFGGVLPAHPANHDKSYFETTYTHFYVDGPEEWRSKAPPPEQADDDRFVAGFHASLNPNAPEKGEVRSDGRMFHHVDAIERDADDPTVTQEHRGKAGARGPLTRGPHEAGSTLGASVFNDEYALRPRT